MRIAGAVLAAGAGRRMGTPKADLTVDGVRLVDRAVAALIAAGVDPVLAVVRLGTRVDGAITVPNPDADSGQRSSLVCAVAAAESAGVDALALLLVDQPGVGAAAVRAVLGGWRTGRIATGVVGERRVHPVVMDLALWREAVALAGPDEGARALLAARPELVDEVDVDVDATDLDTRDDLARWQLRPPS